MTDDPSGVANEAAKFALSLKGEGITVERDVSEDVARDIIAVVMGAAPSVGAGQPTNLRRPSRGRSIREFLDEAEAKKIPQIITVIGEYLMQDGQDHFTRQDVKAKFPKAGEPTPANFTRDFGLAVSSGWIAEDQRNEFYVTEPGRKAIAATFADQKIRGRRRRTTTKAKPKES